jgi:DNA-binding MarR family transcriptional regulator
MNDGENHMPDTPERIRLLQQLGRTYRAFMSGFEKEVGHFMPRWRILLHLYNEARSCPQKDVCEAAHIDPGALSRQLATLEELGWIARATDAQDKRITHGSLTDEGRRQVEASMPRRAAFIERTLGDIDDARLHQLMDDLVLLETRFSARAAEETV